VRGRLIETAVGAHLLRGAQASGFETVLVARGQPRGGLRHAQGRRPGCPSRPRAAGGAIPARLGPLRAPPSPPPAGCLSGRCIDLEISFSPTLSVGSQINYDPPVGFCIRGDPGDGRTALMSLLPAASVGAALWHLELGNVLLHAQRKRRIDKAGIEKFLSALNVYDIEVDPRR